MVTVTLRCPTEGTATSGHLIEVYTFGEYLGLLIQCPSPSDTKKDQRFHQTTPRRNMWVLLPNDADIHTLYRPQRRDRRWQTIYGVNLAFLC